MTLLKAITANTLARADLTRALGAAAPVWESRDGDTPRAIGEVFRQAAKLIEAEGYSSCADSIHVDDRRPRHSVSTALDAAALARPSCPADAADLSEDAHAHLAGFLHLTGLRTRRTSIADLCNEVAAWEDCRPGGSWPTGSAAHMACSGVAMTDRPIRRMTAAAVLLVAAIAAVASFVHIEHLAVTHGQTWLAAVLLPVSINGTVAAASLVMLRAARAGPGTAWLAKFMLTLAVTATLAANVAYGVPFGVAGAPLAVGQRSRSSVPPRWPLAWSAGPA